ncbi:PRSS8 protein, partial [Irena cyanogastra]|nr:PRSS8 protein [Irena cyanogastra]
VSVPLAQLLPHPAYAGEATSGDLALARLARPVRFGPGLGPVCLPAARLRFRPGTACVSTGWGDTGNGGEWDWLDWDGLGMGYTGIYWDILGYTGI